MKKSQLAVNTVSLRGEFVEILDGVAEAGFSQIEFHLAPVKTFLASHETDEVKSLLAERNLICIGGFEGGIETWGDEKTRAANRADLVANGRLLADFGNGNAQSLVIGSGAQPLHEMENPVETYARALATVAEELAPFNVNLLLEFNWGAVKTLALAAEIARRSGVANAGVLFDPAHYYCTPTKMADLTAQNVATIGHVHVNNMRGKPAELSNCNSDRVLPDDSDGVLDLKAIFGALENHGYNGFYSIEMFSEELWNLKPRQAAQKMFDSLLELCE